MKCIICKNELNHFSNNSCLEMPVSHCKNCDMYVTGSSDDEIKRKLEMLYSGEYWEERNVETSIKSNYTDIDSHGKRRNWISQFAYCKKFLDEKKSILEIGVGGGQTIFWFDQINYNVVGIEPDSRNVDLINKKLKNSKVINSFIEDINLKQKFDVIWMSHVLEHLVRPDLFLKKIKNNLKPNGFFFIEVPSSEHKETLESSILDNPHVYHFTKKSLLRLIESDYDIVSCDCFRPATKIEGVANKIFNRFNIYPYYPRILTDCKSGRDLRIILKLK